MPFSSRLSWALCLLVCSLFPKLADGCLAQRVASGSAPPYDQLSDQGCELPRFLVCCRVGFMRADGSSDFCWESLIANHLVLGAMKCFSQSQVEKSFGHI